MSGFKEFAKALTNMMRNQVGVKIAKLEAKADAEYPHTEDECYVAEHMGQLDFEMLNDNGDVYACTLGQVLTLLRARGGGIERISSRAIPDEEDGYIEAFYNIGKLLGIGAGVDTPEHVFKTRMVPRLKELLELERICKTRVIKVNAQNNMGVSMEAAAALMSAMKQQPTLRPEWEGLPTNVKMSSQGVAVDQNYFWNYDMGNCPDGKVQLLTKSGLPHYGRQVEAPGFFIAWAPLPKTRPVE